MFIPYKCQLVVELLIFVAIKKRHLESSDTTIGFVLNSHRDKLMFQGGFHSRLN